MRKLIELVPVGSLEVEAVVAPTITAEDMNYTDDDLSQSQGQQSDSTNGPAGPGVSQSWSAGSSGSDKSKHTDAGERVQTVSGTTDNGTRMVKLFGRRRKRSRIWVRDRRDAGF